MSNLVLPSASLQTQTNTGVKGYESDRKKVAEIMRHVLESQFCHLNSDLKIPEMMLIPGDDRSVDSW